MAKEIRKVHISVSSNASKELKGGTASATGLSRALSGVKGAAGAATGGIRAMTAALMSSGVGLFVVAIGSLVGAFGSIISKSSQFEKALSTLEAVTGSTKQEIQQLSDLAKELGSSTMFTASEVVALQTELAKLGFKTDDIQNSTASILDLAASLGVDLAEAAEFSGSVVRSFGLTTKDTQKIVDVMALSTSSSALNFESLRESMKLVAPVSKAVDVSVEKTTALLAVLADRGLKGSIAGTGLAKTFIELSKQGLTLEQGLDKLNASGGDLNTAIEMVGVVAAKSFLTLAGGQQDIAGLEQSFIDAEGAARKMAEVKQDNLIGDTKELSSAWEGLILSIEDGTGLLNGIARGAVQLLTKAIGGLKDMSFKLGVSWDSLVLLFEYGGITMRKMGSQFTVLGKEIAIFAVDAMIAMRDVPIIGGLVDDATLIAKRKQLTGELEAANKAINDFSIQQFENEKKRNQKNVEYRLGRKLREYKDEEEAVTKAEGKTKTAKDTKISKEEQEALDAKKAFLLKLKKLEQDTDDETQLEKIQRRRERHLKDLEGITMTTKERREAEKTINAIYDAQRDQQIDKNNEANSKKLKNFLKEFGIENEDPEVALNDAQEKHLRELDQLVMNETEKEEAVKRINDYYDAQRATLRETKRVEDAEKDAAELQMKKQLLADGLDLAIEASGEESKIGKALLKIKQAFALAEMLMKMKVMAVNLKTKAKEGMASTAIASAEQSASIGVGVANSAKSGFPFNAIPLALMAAQAAMMVQGMSKSKKEMQQATAGLGAGVGGATPVRPPNFNVIGQASTGENLIADTIAGANQRPIRAFVVDKDIKTTQELARNTEDAASMG